MCWGLGILINIYFFSNFVSIGVQSMLIIKEMYVPHSRLQCPLSLFRRLTASKVSSDWPMVLSSKACLKLFSIFICVKFWRKFSLHRVPCNFSFDQTELFFAFILDLCKNLQWRNLMLICNSFCSFACQQLSSLAVICFVLSVWSFL